LYEYGDKPREAALRVELREKKKSGIDMKAGLQAKIKDLFKRDS